MKHFKEIYTQYKSILDEGFDQAAEEYSDVDSFSDFSNDSLFPHWKVGDFYPDNENPTGIVVFEKGEFMDGQSKAHSYHLQHALVIPLENMTKFNLSNWGRIDGNIIDKKSPMFDGESVNHFPLDKPFIPSLTMLFKLYKNEARQREIALKIDGYLGYNSKPNFLTITQFPRVCWCRPDDESVMTYNLYNNHYDVVHSKSLDSEDVWAAVLPFISVASS